jgi:hypothetical protein
MACNHFVNLRELRQVGLYMHQRMRGWKASGLPIIVP